MTKTKLITLLGIVLSVLLLAAGCGAEPAGTDTHAGVYNDGTYEGTSDKGLHPGLKVAVSIQGDKITEVTVLENQETPGIGSLAIESLPARIIEAQSTEVDSVSGASLSSAAIKEAVDKALQQAKK